MIENSIFLNAYFIDDNRTVIETLWQDKDDLSVRPFHITAEDDNPNYTKLLELITIDDLHEQTYKNIKTYDRATEVTIGGLKVLMLPWINAANEEDTTKTIKKTDCKVAMGHLEINGFRVHRGYVMEEGMNCDILEKFDRVFSGHYHTRSDNGKIFYLGNPYEMFWTDVNDTRGFHIFDTETLELTPVNNPYKLFHNIYYEDTNHKLFNAKEYENKIVKVIVRKKSSPKDFEKFIDKLYSAGIHDLKIVENFVIQECEDFEISEEENTLSILNRYIEEAEFELDKSIIKKIFEDLYREACEVE